jgi:hypothetical protein
MSKPQRAQNRAQLDCTKPQRGQRALGAMQASTMKAIHPPTG